MHARQGWFNGTEFGSIVFANSGYPVDIGAGVRPGTATDFGRLTAARSARVFQFGARFRF